MPESQAARPSPPPAAPVTRLAWPRVAGAAAAIMDRRPACRAGPNSQPCAADVLCGAPLRRTRLLRILPALRPALHERSLNQRVMSGAAFAAACPRNPRSCERRNQVPGSRECCCLRPGDLLPSFVCHQLYVALRATSICQPLTSPLSRTRPGAVIVAVSDPKPPLNGRPE